MIIKIVNTYSVSADYLLGINERETVDVSGLSQEQIAHIQMIIDDIRNKQLFKQKISLISYEVRLILYLLNFNSLNRSMKLLILLIILKLIVNHIGTHINIAAAHCENEVALFCVFAYIVCNFFKSVKANRVWYFCTEVS